MRQPLRVFLLLPVLLAGCPLQENDDEQAADISSSMASYAQRTPCPEIHPGSADIPADLGLTPRADADAEQLALEASCSITAPEAVYQRVSAELTGIRARFPALADYHYHTHYVSSLILQFDETGASAFLTGDYHAWDVLNQAYKAEVDRLFLNDGVLLNIPGRYNLPLLERQYASLPNISAVYINIVQTLALYDRDAPPRRNICLAIDQSDAKHYYLFTEQKTGQGAINIRGSVGVDADGNISALDPRTLMETLPTPGWYQDCLTWLFTRY